MCVCVCVCVCVYIYIFFFFKISDTHTQYIFIYLYKVSKHLGDIDTVLLDLVCLCLFLHVIPDRLMMIRSDLCVEHWLLSDSLCKQKSHWIITINGKINVWKCKLIFPTDILQQKIEITYLNHFLAGENTSVLIIFATTVCVCVCVCVCIHYESEPFHMLSCHDNTICFR